MKKIFVLISLAIPITGCAFTPKLILSLNFKTESDITYVVKRTPQMENCSNPIQYVPNYLWWGTGCIFNFGQRPDKITITYTKWLSQEESFKRYYGKSTFNSENFNTVSTYYNLDNKVVTQDEWVKQGLIRNFLQLISYLHQYGIPIRLILKPL